MNTADMMIHVHPEFDAPTRSELEKVLEGHIGVDCAEFTPHDTHHHMLMVKYDPDAVEGLEILRMVRRLDPVATMVGM